MSLARAARRGSPSSPPHACRVACGESRASRTPPRVARPRGRSRRSRRARASRRARRARTRAPRSASPPTRPRAASSRRRSVSRDAGEDQPEREVGGRLDESLARGEHRDSARRRGRVVDRVGAGSRHRRSRAAAASRSIAAASTRCVGPQISASACASEPGSPATSSWPASASRQPSSSGTEISTRAKAARYG